MADIAPLEPWLTGRDLSIGGEARWEAVDELASTWLGRPVLALPSVRVGLCWTLQHLGYARHRDHVLVPRFMGRCILNSVSRHALPVEHPTPDTRVAVVVDQYGLRQRLDVVAPACASRGWAYVEDSPYGVGVDESPGPGSLGRFIGLGKALPIVMGALLATDREDLAAAVRTQRQGQSPWSVLAWSVMLALRVRRSAGSSSTLAEIAYELYPAGRGGNRWLRGNMARVLAAHAAFEAESAVRSAAVASALKSEVLWSAPPRVGYVAPCFPGAPAAAQAVLRRYGCDAGAYHVDVARNLLAPEYVKALLLPLTPRMPRAAFDAMVRDLGAVAGV